MKFTKEHWYYITEVDGEKLTVQRGWPNKRKWECERGNWIYTGYTRKEAVMNAVNENRK